MTSGQQEKYDRLAILWVRGGILSLNPNARYHDDS
jgi:hypothetical protein